MARKILLADDSVTAQNMGRKILADAGYEVTTVNNGSAALKKIAESRPDLIVLDVYMPGYSGLEVCQRLKETGDTARIPILLTVGKLEPFKPEEAKRVRAEGFIVKPFEASELLSALTKLEDKIVPRSDSSKPGRFARAIAAVEEGRYDNTVPIDENSGWKNRIAFPSKRKEKKPEPEDSDDPAIYNAVNKDLRTTVEYKPISPDAQTGSQVNLGALAPEGLPKDVTPEEIAALAAAAAQVAGVAANKGESAMQSPEGEAKVGTPIAHESTPVANPEIKFGNEAVPAPESKSAEVQPAAPEISQSQAQAAGAILATTEPQEETAPQGIAVATTPTEHAPEPQLVPDPEPVTIAATSDTRVERSSRWTAVAVALSVEETGISIEDEMRHAYAAFVGAQASAANGETPVPVAEITHAPAPSSLASAPQTSETTMPEVTQAFGAAAEAAHASMAAAVKEFEAVATRAAEIPEPAAATSAVGESSPQSLGSSPADTQASDSKISTEQPKPAVAEEPATALTTENSQPGSGIHAEPSHPEPVFAMAQEISPVAEAQAPPEISTHAEQVPAPQASVEAPGHTAEGAESTAPAANWRRIRESAAEPPRDEAAKAVAAGAENAPQEVAPDSSDVPEIASIVDSVLADLRPKIVAEISKKLGKKK